jgi:hypothetical protein
MSCQTNLVHALSDFIPWNGPMTYVCVFQSLDVEVIYHEEKFEVICFQQDITQLFFTFSSSLFRTDR